MTVQPWEFDPLSSAHTLLSAIRQRIGSDDTLSQAVVLGSGWNGVFSQQQVIATFNYHDWPCFPTRQVKGHPGRLQIVRQGERTLLVFAGRFHCYQGLTAFQSAFPVRLASALGCTRLLLCCATGGINSAYSSGDYMLVDDHLNLLGDNPLRGLNSQFFVDLGALYRTGFFEPLSTALGEEGGRLHLGVLAAMPGPSYETPAEVRMLRGLGADVVSMSVVPEAIMARNLGMEVAAVALVANPAAGLSSQPICHDDVLECGRVAMQRSSFLVQKLLDLWA
ncbi:MAG: purine-nucleoside phosphorylase [Desulfuromonas sp.]|nr:MAG: purine-nucleoside phosphorylase [Desulfuromonas sp.]